MNLITISSKIIRYIINKNYRFLVNAAHGIYNNLNDEEYIKRLYKAVSGKELDLKHPKTYNEKLQYLKLYDRNPLYTTLVDKYDVKKFISETIGEEYVIPTLGVWDSFDEIDFDKLPEQFVLKCTHDSGGVVICKDKSALDIEKAKKKISNSLKNNFYLQYREWPYKNVKPRIIAEQYMEDSSTNELRDYKFLTFNGEVKALFIITNRFKGRKEMSLDFFDKKFNHLPFTRKYPNADTLPQKPKTFKKMIELAEKLSKGIPHVRVDFYEVDEKIYFGEMTFYPGSGYEFFNPSEWDEIFGNWIDLTKVSQ